MRAPLAVTFHESVNSCFNSTLEEMGAGIRDWVYSFLEKKNISQEEIASRFNDVMKLLMERLGNSARVIVYRTMIKLHKEFAIAADFTYQDSLPDRYDFLKQRVVSDRLTPKRV